MQLKEAIRILTQGVTEADPQAEGPVTPLVQVGRAPKKALHNVGPGILVLQSGTRHQGVGDFEIARSEIDGYLTPVLYLHCKDRVEERLDDEYILDSGIFTPGVVRYIKKNFPTIEITPDGTNVRLDASRLTAEENTDLHFDIKFYKAHPGINAENVCSTLYNYQPQTHSQHRLLIAAAKLAAGGETQGLFLRGATGVGKTHISIALAKELTKRGGNVFLTTGKEISIDRVKLAKANFIIVDDLNEGWAHEDMVCAIADHVEKTGARVFVTSNHATFEVLILRECLGSMNRERRQLYGAKLLGMFQQINFDDAVASFRQTNAWYTDETLSTTFPPSRVMMPKDMALVELPPDLFHGQTAKTFACEYPELSILHTRTSLHLDVSGIPRAKVGDLLWDLEFLVRNPAIDRESACCKVSNYKPRNKSQTEMLLLAAQLINYKGANPSGLFLQGEAGTGKTHAVIAIAKEFMKNGDSVYLYRPGDSYSEVDNRRLAEANVVIVDDLNGGYARGDDFKKIVDHIHRIGGKLFITSNSTWEKLFHELFAGDDGNKMKYADRCKGMFKETRVVGESVRGEKPWYLEKISCKSKYMPRDIQLQNPRAREAYRAACRLVNYTGEKASGLFLFGNDEESKYKIVGQLEQAFRSKYIKTVVLDDAKKPMILVDSDVKRRMAEAEVIILKNYNTGYARGNTLQLAVRTIHKSGGILIMTSTRPYEAAVLSESFVCTEHERMRYDDRMRSMFQFFEF
jgi:DNA replication protein DnaC